MAPDRAGLQASCHQAYRTHFAPRHAKELLRLADVILGAEEEVATARGDSQKEAARCALTNLQPAQRDLIVKRDEATQQLVSVFDPAEVTRLYASSDFCQAVEDLCDREAVVNAVLAIYQARCSDS